MSVPQQIKQEPMNFQPQQSFLSPPQSSASAFQCSLEQPIMTNAQPLLPSTSAEMMIMKREEPEMPQLNHNRQLFPLGDLNYAVPDSEIVTDDLDDLPFEEMEELSSLTTATVVPCENFPVLGTFATELTSECQDLNIDWQPAAVATVARPHLDEVQPHARLPGQGHGQHQIVHNFPVTVEQQETFVMDDVFSHVRQPDSALLSSEEECDSPRSIDSFHPFSARANLVSGDLDLAEPVLEHYRPCNHSVTVQEPMALSLESDCHFLTSNPVDGESECHAAMVTCCSDEEYETGRHSVAIEEAMTYCIEEGLDLDLVETEVYEARNVLETAGPASLCSVVVEEPATYHNESGMATHHALHEVPGEVIVSAHEVEPRMEDGHMKLASVEARPIVFEEELAEETEVLEEIMFSASSAGDVVTETCPYDRHNFRSDVDIFPNASTLCFYEPNQEDQ